MTNDDRVTYRAFLKARGLSERLLTLHNIGQMGGDSEYHKSRAAQDFGELLLAMQDAGIFKEDRPNVR